MFHDKGMRPVTATSDQGHPTRDQDPRLMVGPSSGATHPVPSFYQHPVVVDDLSVRVKGMSVLPPSSTPAPPASHQAPQVSSWYPHGGPPPAAAGMYGPGPTMYMHPGGSPMPGGSPGVYPTAVHPHSSGPTSPGTGGLPVLSGTAIPYSTHGYAPAPVPRPITAPPPVAATATDSWRYEDFQKMDTLGTGTFGRVRIVRHVPTGRFYAMKSLRKSQIIRMKQVEHLRSERQILALTSHPFIVRLYKTFQDQTHIHMVMEYVCGGELFTHLRRAGKFPNDVARFYSALIVLVFEHLHSLDICYRDLKPENLLLDTDGYVKVTDFGFAKIVTERTYTLCGTPEYLAPEIIQSKGHNKSVDWWALGILIYEMLVGHPPFFDTSAFKVYEKILSGKFECPKTMHPDAKDLIRQLLTADRSRRLGMLKDGTEDVKRHRWFKGVDWDALLKRQIRAPIPVRIQSPGDTHYFERYPEVEDVDITQLTPAQQELFRDF